MVLAMRIRKAKKADFLEILALAKKYDLDYADMKDDDFWVVEAEKKIVGICGIKKHEDCQELCSLGVDENYRNKGLARQLVLELLKKTKGEIYLATIMPRFFEKFGFKEALRIPQSMIKNKDWCRGCPKEFCTVMARESK